jgi:hypothetical protein
MKNFLTYLALVGFTTVSVVSVVRAVRTEWKRGPAFDAAALGAWLVSPEHEEVKTTSLRRAARQLEQEFHDQVDRRAEYEALDDAARSTYEANWRRLLMTLLRQHADAYAATPPHLREAFVSQRLLQFAGWYAFDDGKRVAAADVLKSGGADDAEAIRLDPAERERIRDFTAAMQQAAFKKIWGRLVPGDAASKRERDDP